MKCVAAILIWICVFCSAFSVDRGANFPGKGIEFYAATVRQKYINEESVDISKEYALKIKEKAEAEGNKLLSAECSLFLAQICYLQGEYKKSLSYVQPIPTEAKKLNNNVLMAGAYEMMGHLYYLFSPERAQFYYRMSWDYSEKSDSINAVISSLSNYSLLQRNPERASNYLFDIRTEMLNSEQRAKIGYLIARSLIDENRIDEAESYLGPLKDYLSGISGESFHRALYFREMAVLALKRGRPEEAKIYLAESNRITDRNKFVLVKAHNFGIASNIEKTLGNRYGTLAFYKDSVALRDSIMNTADNRELGNELVINLIKDLSDRSIIDRQESRPITSRSIAVLMTLILIIGASILYYLKSSNSRKPEKQDRTEAEKKNEPPDTDPNLKEHLLKIMFRYKNGVNHCIKQMTETAETPEKHQAIRYFDNWGKSMKDADKFIDDLMHLTEKRPNMTAQRKYFRIRPVTERVVHLHKIICAAKRLNFDIDIDEAIEAYGDETLFAVATEHLMHKTTKNGLSDGTVRVSAKYVGNDVVIQITDPDNREMSVEKKIFMQRVQSIDPNGEYTKTADGDFNVCAEFVRRNNGKIGLEIDPESGTSYRIGIPKYENTNA